MLRRICWKFAKDPKQITHASRLFMVLRSQTRPQCEYDWITHIHTTCGCDKTIDVIARSWREINTDINCTHHIFLILRGKRSPCKRTKPKQCVYSAMMHTLFHRELHGIWQVVFFCCKPHLCKHLLRVVLFDITQCKRNTRALLVHFIGLPVQYTAAQIVDFHRQTLVLFMLSVWFALRTQARMRQVYRQYTTLRLCNLLRVAWEYVPDGWSFIRL